MYSRCNPNRQWRASDAHPYTAVCTRRHRLTTQSESETSFTLPLVLHRPYPRFGDDQRARNDNWQPLCPPTLVDLRTTQYRSARTIAGYIHCPTEPTAVRTTRAYRRTTLCNPRAQFRAIAGTPNRDVRTELCHHGCTRSIAGSARECHTIPSVLNQNGLMYGVIRRQDIGKKGPTTGCKTAMVSNRTAITLRCVLGQAPANRDRPNEAHFAASSWRPVLRSGGAYQTVC